MLHRREREDEDEVTRRRRINARDRQAISAFGLAICVPLAAVGGAMPLALLMGGVFLATLAISVAQEPLRLPQLRRGRQPRPPPKRVAPRPASRLDEQHPRVHVPEEERVRRRSQAGRRAARALLREIEASPQFVRGFFDQVPGRVRRLLAKYAALCRRLVRLEAELDEDEIARLADERERVAQRAEETRDPVARKGFLAAQTSLDRTLDSLAGLERDASRIEAQLAYIEAQYESARARIVRIKTASGVESASSKGEIARSVAALDAEVEALSQAVDEVFGETGGVPELTEVEMASLDEERLATPPPVAAQAPPSGAMPLLPPRKLAAPDEEERPRAVGEETRRRRMQG